MKNKKTKRSFSPGILGNWYKERERMLEPFVFIGGFIFDNLTLVRIDRVIDILILTTWLFVAGMGIVLLNVSRHKVVRGEFFESVGSWAPILIQFAFGALFSGFTIFYMRSATIATSWPFLVIVLFLFFGNEFFKERYLRLNFQLSIFFVSVFFLSIFFVPILFGKMGTWVFLFSGAISIAIVGAFVHFLFAILPATARESKRPLVASIGTILLMVNILYFANILPPIPLSLKDAGVYHFVARTSSGNYIAKDEPRIWQDFFRIYDQIHIVPGQPIYFYSAVFAPTRLNTNIMHRWQYYDTIKKQWVPVGNIRFPIFGGADGGYRGYSEKTALTPGKWRVDVTNDQGQVLGRTRFEITYVTSSPVFETLNK